VLIEDAEPHGWRLAPEGDEGDMHTWAEAVWLDDYTLPFERTCEVIHAPDGPAIRVQPLCGTGVSRTA
jgi:hypothetical protein